MGLGVDRMNAGFDLDDEADALLGEARAELLFEARRSELRVAECAVTHYPRTAGRQSGASLRVIATALMELGRFVARGPRDETSSARGLASQKQT